MKGIVLASELDLPQRVIHSLQDVFSRWLMPKIVFKELCCLAFVWNTDWFIRRQSNWFVIYISINPQVIYLLNRGK